MKVLVNASNLTKGGGVQVAASFISETLAGGQDIDWHYAVSTPVAFELRGLGLEVPNMREFAASPARDKSVRRALVEYEAELVPDVVFSVFGPAYVRFKSPHLLGVAVGWVTHSTRLAYAQLPSTTARIKSLLSAIYKGWWLRYADRWVVEAENARCGLSSRMRIPLAKIDVVPNAPAAAFTSRDLPAAQWPGRERPARLLYVSAYYPHKCLEFIPQVAVALRRDAPDLDFSFAITLPEADAAPVLAQAHRLGVAHHIENIGPVAQHELVDRYLERDICFMPSVLETFSANYVESMAAGRPIVTSDLDFAHAVCGDSAVYFNALDPGSAAAKILELLDDRDLWHNCIQRGRATLAQLPTARTRYEQYVAAIRALYDRTSTESQT
jgi:glycosyltransferase involved in cell wall biosynthesis